MSIDYDINQIQAMPFETHEYIFAFWPGGLENYPYENFMTEVYDWCLESFDRQGWYVSGNKVFLDNDDQAMPFKLRWE